MSIQPFFRSSVELPVCELSETASRSSLSLRPLVCRIELS